MDEQNELDAVSEQLEEQSAEGSEGGQEKEPEFEIPEKYKGKPLKAVFEELEHANKNMGRYANELGELRKLSDELIKSQLRPQQEQPAPKEVDFFENPQEAIRRQIESNPEVQSAKQYAMQARQVQAKQQLQQMHPDYQQVMQDQGFAQWVSKSPVRKHLLQQADSQYDLMAADELLSTYKELRGVKAPQQQAVLSEPEKAARDKSLSAASVESSGTGESSKKILRRADILKLMMQPAKYREREQEIALAYAEGRVR
jgi:hypothetical protein